MPRRKRTDEFYSPGTAGRPPKDPMERVGWPIRALVTHKVIDALKTSMKLHDLPTRDKRTKVSSDIVRLAIARLLIHDGLMTGELLDDDTWVSLREKGLL